MATTVPNSDTSPEHMDVAGEAPANPPATGQEEFPVASPDDGSSLPGDGDAADMLNPTEPELGIDPAGEVDPVAVQQEQVQLDETNTEIAEREQAALAPPAKGPLLDYDPTIFGENPYNPPLTGRPDNMPQDGEFQVAGGKAELAAKVWLRTRKVLFGDEDARPPMDERDMERMRHHFDKPGYALGDELDGLNYHTFNTTGDVDQVMQTLIDMHETGAKKIRGFDTDVETNKFANAIGLTPARLLARRNNQAFSAAELKASQAIVTGAMTRLKSLHEAAKANTNPENLMTLRQHAAITAGLVLQFRGARAEAGRALRALRRDQVIQTKEGREAEVKDMMDMMGGFNSSRVFMDRVGKFIEDGDDAGLARFVTNSRNAKTVDMMFEAWINAMLGSPATHAVNLVSNTAIAFNQVTERWVAAIAGNVEHVMTGRVLVGEPLQGVSFGEAKDYTIGALKGIWDGFKMIPAAAMGKPVPAQHAMHKFVNPREPAITASNIKNAFGRALPEKILKEGGATATVVDVIGEWYFRLPGKALVSTDVLFQAVNYRAELHAQINRAVREGALTGDAAKEFKANALANPEFFAPKLHLKSVDHARYATLTNPGGEVAEAFNEGRIAMHLMKIPIGRMVVPFFRVINNLVKYPLHRMGGDVLQAGLFKGFQEKLVNASPAERQLLIGRWSTGAAFLAGASAFSSDGRLTGHQTDNPRLRQILDTQGKPPNSVLIPWSTIDPEGKFLGELHDGKDTWYSYDRTAPFGMFLNVIAETRDAMAYVTDPEEGALLAAAATSAISGFMMEQSSFLGVSQLLDAVSPSYEWGDARVLSFGRWFGKLLATAPGAIAGPLAPGTPLQGVLRREGAFGIEGDKTKRMAAADPKLEPLMRLWQETINRIKNRTLGLSKDLPPYRNAWGEEVLFQGGLGPDMVSPVYSHELKYNTQALRDAGLDWAADEVSFVGKRVGVDMDFTEWESFIKVVGISGELERLGMPLAGPKKRIGSYQLGPHEKDDLIILRAGIKLDYNGTDLTLKEALEELIKTDEYKEAPYDKDAEDSKWALIKDQEQTFDDAARVLFTAPPGEDADDPLVQLKWKLVPKNYSHILRFNQEIALPIGVALPEEFRTITFPSDFPRNAIPKGNVAR